MAISIFRGTTEQVNSQPKIDKQILFDVTNGMLYMDVLVNSVTETDGTILNIERKNFGKDSNQLPEGFIPYIGDDGYWKLKDSENNVIPLGWKAQGPQGPQGATGPQGDEGPVGPAPKIFIGSVVTESENKQVGITANQNEITKNVTLDFVLPKGTPGNDGKSSYIKIAYTNNINELPISEIYTYNPENPPKYLGVSVTDTPDGKEFKWMRIRNDSIFVPVLSSDLSTLSWVRGDGSTQASLPLSNLRGPKGDAGPAPAIKLTYKVDPYNIKEFFETITDFNEYLDSLDSFPINSYFVVGNSILTYNLEQSSWTEVNKVIKQDRVDVVNGITTYSYTITIMKGPQGEQGLSIIGPKGDKGDTGIQGVQGPQGPQGERGIQGATGAQGIQGPKGTDGKDGTGVNIKGTATLGTATETTDGTILDDQNNVIVGTSGDSYLIGPLMYVYVSPSTFRCVGNIQGPKGDKGDQGIQGVKGDKGDQGIQGQQGVQGIQGQKGNTGVSIRNRGAWSPSTEYVNNNQYIDIVTYNFNTYICKTTHTSAYDLLTDISKWEYIAGKGDKGDRGEKGDTNSLATDSEKLGGIPPEGYYKKTDTIYLAKTIDTLQVIDNVQTYTTQPLTELQYRNLMNSSKYELTIITSSTGTSTRQTRRFVLDTEKLEKGQMLSFEEEGIDFGFSSGGVQFALTFNARCSINQSTKVMSVFFYNAIYVDDDFHTKTYTGNWVPGYTANVSGPTLHAIAITKVFSYKHQS